MELCKAENFDLEENSFDVVVIGELILKWTSHGIEDKYRYELKGFSPGDFVAFGLMIDLHQPSFIERMAIGNLIIMLVIYSVIQLVLFSFFQSKSWGNLVLYSAKKSWEMKIMTF